MHTKWVGRDAWYGLMSLLLGVSTERRSAIPESRQGSCLRLPADGLSQQLIARSAIVILAVALSQQGSGMTNICRRLLEAKASRLRCEKPRPMGGACVIEILGGSMHPS